LAHQAPAILSRRFYSRDPLQAEHEANTVRGHRAARIKSEEQAKQQQGGKQDGHKDSYQGEWSANLATVSDPAATV
jgi:phosphatidylserine decarboxylase